MAKKIVRYDDISPHQAVEIIKKKLRRKGVEFKELSMTDFRTFDIHNFPVVFVRYRHSAVFCAVRQSHEGRLLGNQALEALLVKFSGFKGIGLSVSAIINCGVFNAIRLSYFEELPAVVVDPRLMLRRLK